MEKRVGTFVGQNKAVGWPFRKWYIISIRYYRNKSTLMGQEFTGAAVLLFDPEENNTGEVTRQALHKHYTRTILRRQ